MPIEQTDNADDASDGHCCSPVKQFKWRKTITVEPLVFIFATCLLLTQSASQRTMFTSICIRNFASGQLDLSTFVVNGTVLVNSSSSTGSGYIVRVNHTTNSSSGSSQGTGTDYQQNYDYYYYYGESPSKGSNQDSASSTVVPRTAVSPSSLVTTVQRSVSFDAYQFCTVTIFQQTSASRAANNYISASTSQWNTINTLSTTVPGLFSGWILSAYSDMRNRRRLLFQIAFTASFINACAYAVVAFSPVGPFTLSVNGKSSAVAFTRTVPTIVYERLSVPIVSATQSTNDSLSNSSTIAASPSDPDYYADSGVEDDPNSNDNDTKTGVTFAAEAMSEETTVTAAVDTVTSTSTTADYSTASTYDSISWVPYELVLLGEFAEGVFGGQSLVTASAFAYVNVVVKNDRSRAARITIIQATLYIGAGIGTLVSGFMMQVLNVAYVFIIIAALMIVGFLYSTFWLRELPVTQAPNKPLQKTTTPQPSPLHLDETTTEIDSDVKSGNVSSSVNDVAIVTAANEQQRVSSFDAVLSDSKADFKSDLEFKSSDVLDAAKAKHAMALSEEEEEDGTQTCSCWSSCSSMFRSTGVLVCSAIRSVFRKRNTRLETVLFGLTMISIQTFILVLSADKSLSFLYLTGTVYGLSTSVYGMFNAGVYFVSCLVLLAGLPPLQRALPRVAAHWFALPGVVGKIIYLALLGAALSGDIYYLVIMVLASSLQGWTLASLRICVAKRIEKSEQTRVFTFMNSCEVLILSLGSLLFNYIIYPQTLNTFPAAAFYVGSFIGVIVICELLVYTLLLRRIRVRQRAASANANVPVSDANLATVPPADVSVNAIEAGNNGNESQRSQQAEECEEDCDVMSHI